MRRGILRLGTLALVAGLLVYLLLTELAQPSPVTRPRTRQQHAEASRYPLPPGMPTQLPLRQSLLASCVQEIRSYALVANLAGEIEACNCVGGSASGGLMQTLYVIQRLRDDAEDLIVVDAGGNTERADGLLSAADLPPTYFAALETLWRTNSPPRLEGGVLFVDNRELAVGLTDFDARSRNVVVVHIVDGGPHATGELQDVTLPVRIELVRAAVEPATSGDAAERIRQLLSAGFVAETVRIGGAGWQDVPQLNDLRRKLITEWVGQRPQPTVDAVTLAGGSSACIACHAESVAGHNSQNTHARAWQTLQRHGAIANPFCVACHTTALPHDAYFENPVRVPDANQSVACLACHASDDRSDSACDHYFTRPPVDICSGCHTGGRRPIGPRLQAADGSGVPLSSFVGCSLRKGGD